MKWNVVLLVVSIFLLVLAAGGEFANPLAQADALSEDIGPKLGVSVDRLRPELQDGLLQGAERRAILNSILWCVLPVLLAVRLVVDLRGARLAHRANQDVHGGRV